jgi:hypothetical protein
MRLISHRGNINGPNTERENTWAYIQEALDAGYDVELDVWGVDNKLWLGHDGPKEEIRGRTLLNPKLWIHCKNLQAYDNLSMATVFYNAPRLNDLNIFYHQNDDCVLTTSGFLWTYPGKPLGWFSIAVKPESVKENWNLTDISGICSDYIERYK